MAPNDMDVVRDQFEAVNERDFAKAMDAYADDVVLVVDLDFVDPGTYEGREAVGRWFGRWFSTFEPGYRFKFEEIRMISGRVYLDASHGGRGKASGIEVAGRMGYLYGAARREDQPRRAVSKPSSRPGGGRCPS